MKKMISFLLLLGSVLAVAQPPVPAHVKLSEPIRIEPFDDRGMGYAEKIYDFALGNNGTTTDSIIGNVFDIRKLGLVRHYEGDTSVVTGTLDSLIGQMTYSCYDVADSAAVTDSVAFVGLLQGSDFAANNSNPGTAASDAWYTIRTFTLLGTSASSAQVTADTLKAYLPVATHNTQFIRLYGSNLSTVAQNDMRCRVFLYRPRWNVQ